METISPWIGLADLISSINCCCERRGTSCNQIHSRWMPVTWATICCPNASWQPRSAELQGNQPLKLWFGSWTTKPLECSCETKAVTKSPDCNTCRFSSPIATAGTLGTMGTMGGSISSNGAGRSKGRSGGSGCWKQWPHSWHWNFSHCSLTFRASSGVILPL